MIWEMSAEASQIFHMATKTPLVGLPDQPQIPAFNRQDIMNVLPHRDPFLLLDRVVTLDIEKGLIIAQYDLTNAHEVLSGHFPGNPIWPGVLHIESIGQAGIFLYQRWQNASEQADTLLTHILRARFIHPITPGEDVTILARIFDEGLFAMVVGQCVQRNIVASAAAVRILM